MADPLARLRSFPKAGPPNDDAAAVRGTATDEQKQLNMNALAHFVAAGTSVFGSEQAKDLRLVEANIRSRKVGSGNPDAIEAEAILEIEVQEGMLNVDARTMAGPFIAHLIEISTSSALFTLGVALNRDPTGPSQALEVKYHAPALPGMLLIIVATTQVIKGRSVSGRAEIFEKKSGRLIASGVHTISPYKTPTNAAPKISSKL